LATDARDPRSIVTPAAFGIDPSLLGLPLAAPSRRFWALAIDLALLGLLTAVLSSVMLFVWAAIALALIRVALKRSARSTRAAQTAGILMRSSAGCLGTFILVVVIGMWAMRSMDDDDRDAALEEVIERGAGLVGPQLRNEMGDVMNYDSAGTPDEALAVMTEGARRMRDFPLALRRQMLRTSVPPEAPWAAQSDSLIELALASDRAAREDTAGDSTATAGGEEMNDSDVLRAFAAEAASPSPDSARLRDLRARAADVVVADTLEAVADRVEDLEAELEDEREARRELEQEVTESRSGVAAFARLFRDVFGSAGSAFGLWTLYFTVLLTRGRGQTIGKRMMRVRVLRLDGQPIGWWAAFERAGGYAAGLATGFLGFAQLLWDPNRQCIHDKIAGTVVVVDGAERAAWEEAWARRTTS
jgi:hypothetical protein